MKAELHHTSWIIGCPWKHWMDNIKAVLENRVRTLTEVECTNL